MNDVNRKGHCFWLQEFWNQGIWTTCARRSYGSSRTVARMNGKRDRIKEGAFVD